MTNHLERPRYFRGDVEYVHTSASIPKYVRELAAKHRISMSRALEDGIKNAVLEITTGERK